MSCLSSFCLILADGEGSLVNSDEPAAVMSGGGESNFRSESSASKSDVPGNGGDENCRKLKFGIDAILSTEAVARSTRERDTLDYGPHSTDYHSKNLHCCYQYGNGIETPMHFYPSLFVSSAPILPSVKRFTNFVIEADKSTSNHGTSKRKRIWSRAVFSKLQRKGLEKRFQTQKYIMKPDRKQLAASLGLTDAQVKVWFQNRRMKWRNRKENSSSISSVNETSE